MLALEMPALVTGYGGIQVYRDAPRPQIADSQHAADDVAAKIVKHEDLPYRIAIRIEYGGRLGDGAVGGGAVEDAVAVLGRIVVEVQDLLDGSLSRGQRCRQRQAGAFHTYLPDGPSKTDF